MRRFGPLLLLALPALCGTVTDAWISGLPTTSVTARADAYYNLCGIYCGGGDPNFISASADVLAITLGPVRSGYIEMTGNGSGEYGAGRVSVGNYSYLCGELCPIPNGVWMPFTLGVPFDIDVSADAMILGPVYGAGDISLQFSLFENTGASVVVYDAAAAVPEPAMFTAVGLGLLGLVAFGRIPWLTPGVMTPSRRRKSYAYIARLSAREAAPGKVKC
jgi:hypothetical protein